MTDKAQSSDKLKILFVCTGNSCRSQMAEAWTNHLKGDVAQAWSAGTKPAGMNRLAIRSMAEAGIDISHAKSKSVDEVKDIDFDVVVTVCDSAREACPVFPGAAKTVHAGFEDPPELARAQNVFTDDEAIKHYNRVRDEIRHFVEQIPGILEKHGPYND